MEKKLYSEITTSTAWSVSIDIASKWQRRYWRIIVFTGSEGEIIEHLRYGLKLHKRDTDSFSQIHVNGHVQVIEQISAHPGKISHHGYLQIELLFHSKSKKFDGDILIYHLMLLQFVGRSYTGNQK